jgi:hypothetical protein
MKKTLYLLGIAVFVLTAGIAIAAPHHGPDSVVIDAAAAKKGPVTFPHKEHVERVESCDTCHHTSPGLTAAADTEVQKCSACHLDPEKAETPGMREMSMKKNPFHMVCIDCHKAETKGPTKCDDCHKK